MKMMLMNCTQIDQLNADKLLKKMTEDSLYKAFRIEWERRNEPIWALPSEKRIYYTVSISGVDILFAGINRKTLELSSIGKLADSGQFRGQGRCCLKKLIETVLIPLCKDDGKVFFGATFSSPEGKTVLRYLMNDKPKGITKIDPSDPSFCATFLGATFYIG